VTHNAFVALFLSFACVLLLGFACERGASRRTNQPHVGAIRGRLEYTTVGTPIAVSTISCYRVHIHLECTSEGLSVDSLVRVQSALIDSVSAAVRPHFISDTFDLNEPDDERGRFLRMESDGSFNGTDLPEGIYSVELHRIACPGYGIPDWPMYGQELIGVRVKAGLAARILVPPPFEDLMEPEVWKEAYEPI
jgi:hypothetical protein